MIKKELLYSILFFFCILTISSCKKEKLPIKVPNTNIRIDPKTAQYYKLHSAGGFEYVTNKYPSRGIIVYRTGQGEATTEFVAFERTPPNYPNECKDENGNYSSLVVDFPFMVDKCTGIKYSILDGAISDKGKYPNEKLYPAVQYKTYFERGILRVYN